MITVYESRETNFKHNGLGVLRPSSCLIYEELNGEYSLTLKHPIDNYEKWKLLEQDRIIKANGQLFRIYKLTHSIMDNEVEVFAMHIFYDLSKNFIRDINIVDKTGKQALNHILDNTLYENNFTCDSDITKINSARLVRKNVTSVLIGDDENSFLKYWGGELKRDNFNFQINTVVGENKGMKISYGKNLTGLTAMFDMSNIATRIVPVAFDGITLPEVYVDSDYVNNYAQPIVREVKFSDVKFASSPNNASGEGFATKEEVYAELRRLSRLMFTNDKVDVPEINFNVDFVELSKTEQYKKYSNLETVGLGDVVNIHHKVLGINIDARVISYEFNCLTNRYDSIELGSFQTNIFTGISELIKREDVNMQTITDLINVSYENAVNEATLLITNGLGGYVVKTRDELLIMDSDDINTAKNVWRWNINGLGFSSTGYNGTYGLAMTHDGQIVADRITAGELNGEIIKANSITTNHLQVEAARKIENSQSEEEVRTLIEATLGSFEVTITDKYEAKIDDELNSFSKNYYTKVETESKIQQNAESITTTVNANYTTLNEKFNNYPTTTQMNSAIAQTKDSIKSEVSKIEKSMAIDNLLANGNFTNGLNNWTYNAFEYDINYDLSSNTDYTMVGKTALLLLSSYHPQGVDSGFTQTIDVKPNTNYTFTGYIASHRAEGMVIVKDDAGNWLVFDKTDPDSEQYTGGEDITKWKRVRLVYYSGNRYKLLLHLALGTSYENGHVWFHDFMVTEGDTDLCWKPSERETRTQINQLSDRITSTVSSVETVDGKVNQAQSQIDQLSDSITSTVSSIQTVDGKVNQAQSQIDQQAQQIASKVNSGDLSSLIKQNSSSIYAAISDGRGVNGVGIDASGLYLHNNNLVTAKLTEGKFHAYNSLNGNHMGYFGTNGDDLRACLYGTNTFSVYSDDTALLFKARYERDASYGNATLDMCGGINFIHKTGQDVGLNQILLGNDDRADIYGYHNLSIRAHNSLGFMDNNGLTHMFFATRTGSIVMKGTVYQNSQSGISTFSLLRSREVVNDYGYTTEDMVNSILTLETSVNVDENEDYSMRICSSENELVTKILGDSLHIDQGSVIAGLVETVKSLNNRILELESKLNEKNK